MDLGRCRRFLGGNLAVQITFGRSALLFFVGLLGCQSVAFALPESDTTELMIQKNSQVIVLTNHDSSKTTYSAIGSEVNFVNRFVVNVVDAIIPSPVDVRVSDVKRSVSEVSLNLSWQWVPGLGVLSTAIESSLDGGRTWKVVANAGPGERSAMFTTGIVGEHRFRLRHVANATVSDWTYVLPQITVSFSYYGSGNVCVLDLLGSVSCDGKEVLGLPLVEKIVAGTYMTCAISRDHRVYCWGYQEYGILGNGLSSGSSPYIAQMVLGLTGVSDIAAGQSTTCAILGGKVWCWGQNFGGSLGSNNANRSFSSTPVLNSDFTDAERIWGRPGGLFIVQSPTNLDGGLGQGDIHSVAPATGMVVNTRHELGNTSNVEEVDGWQETSCLVSRTQLVSCWGRNDVGQAGDGSNPSNGVTPPESQSPKLVVGLSAAVRVGVARSSTYFFACALEADSELRCWGRHSKWEAVYPQGIGVAQLWGVGPPIGLEIALVPSAPIEVASIASDAEATVSWTAPASNGSPITNYTVTAEPGGATCITSATSCVVRKLTNGTAYTFRVTAQNKIGIGVVSGPSLSVVPHVPLSTTVTSTTVTSTTVTSTTVTSPSTILSMSLKKGLSYSSTSLTRLAGVVKPPGGKVLFSSQSSICRVSSGKLKVLKSGTCKVTFVVTNAKKKITRKVISFKVK